MPTKHGKKWRIRPFDERGNRVAGGVTAARMINMTATGRPRVVATPADVVCP